MSQWSKVGNIMGPAGPAGSMVCGEVPRGVIDGNNRNFQTAIIYVANTLRVYLNGLRQQRLGDYTETDNQSFQFVEAPWVGSTVTVDYTMTTAITGGDVVRETPSGVMDGANATFILANDPQGTEQLFLNGMLLEPGTGNDYTISAKVITLAVAPKAGGRLKANYSL